MSNRKDIYSGELALTFTSVLQALSQKRKAKESLISSFSKHLPLEQHDQELIDGFLEDLYKWAHIVDELTLQHTVAVWKREENSFRTLWVYIDSTVLSSQFQMSKSLYLAHIDMVYKDSWVDDIQFKYSPYKTQRELMKNLSEKKPPHLDKAQLSLEELHEIEELCAYIQDEKLSQAARRAMVACYKRAHLS